MDFTKIPAKILADKGLYEFADFIITKLESQKELCTCQLPKGYDCQTLYNKITTGESLTETEQYTLIGHIEEEWHADTANPMHISCYTQQKDAECYAFKYNSYIIIKFGALFLVTVRDYRQPTN